MSMLINDSEYIQTMNEIKVKIYEAHRNALISANREIISLYWNVGKMINERNSWGSKFVQNLSRDIALDFPRLQGFSKRNMQYMAKFNVIYPDFEFVQRALHKLPWRTNVAIMEKIKDPAEREWYIAQVIKNGWSRDLLVHQFVTAKTK